MRDHVLLQAIARVNRPYEDNDGLIKPYGFVLDFVGIFKNLEKALAFDSDVVGSVIRNLDVLKDLFAKLIQEDAEHVFTPCEGDGTIGRKSGRSSNFEDTEGREAFFKFFKQLQNIYTILSPDAFSGHPFIDDYQSLASLYGLIRNAYADRIYVDKELTAKTRELLQQHTASNPFALPGSIQELDANTLREIKQSYVSDKVKVLNLRKILHKTVTEESRSKPFLISIGERAEALTEAYENRQLITQQALTEFEKLADEYTQASSERAQMDLDENAYAVYKVLEGYTETIRSEQARDLNRVFDQFSDYRWDTHQNSQLRRMFYLTLRPIVGAENLIEATNALLKLERI